MGHGGGVAAPSPLQRQDLPATGKGKGRRHETAPCRSEGKESFFLPWKRHTGMTA
ncbi:MAG TPA: hypothetical protein DEF41_02390 [Desulfovibrio sp.]|uniref:Uncharacterized protein n=1 Tax=Nitratidesulfovibrio vulgaris (strain ATCC 29579 / DSM 644 / CCUG 34227 / NCIMB 8303 / VKM B-1760 / Hildenborough) TaxID=882 RepID=Q725W9_NITV2|nr:hypothetical protein DVU_3306 [Nitratidesulfovibrio vulgaris str. Hildenborough]HBW14997.1 hypothetical protein [Desulfovibrio sp.]